MNPDLNYKKKKLKVSVLVVGASAFIGLLVVLLTDSLKMLTERYEHQFFTSFSKDPWLIFVLPLAGLLSVYIFRRFLFNNKPNKGIREVLTNLEKKKPLPAYKIFSHYINGLLTVSLGGSTGIEVSTVVSAAATGSVVSEKSSLLKKHKNTLISAGIAAGVTALFNAPLAGMLFALEVFTKKINPTYFLSLLTAVTVGYLVNNALGSGPVFHFHISGWHLYALPYFILLGVIAGMHAAYLTGTVLYIKRIFSGISREIPAIIAGALLLSVLIFFLPALYGEGYHALPGLLKNLADHSWQTLAIIALVIVLKPVATAITLGAGGDGGVFAPSLFAGAFLGFFIARILNLYFQADVIEVNFMIAGMAALLSGSIHAPFTAIFLVCAAVGSYELFVPVLIASLVARITSYFILPYSVYTFQPKEN